MMVYQQAPYAGGRVGFNLNGFDANASVSQTPATEQGREKMPSVKKRSRSLENEAWNSYEEIPGYPSNLAKRSRLTESNSYWEDASGLTKKRGFDDLYGSGSNFATQAQVGLPRVKRARYNIEDEVMGSREGIEQMEPEEFRICGPRPPQNPAPIQTSNQTPTYSYSIVPYKPLAIPRLPRWDPTPVPTNSSLIIWQPSEKVIRKTMEDQS